MTKKFDSIIFSGGGSRCTWQVGFLSSLKEKGLKTPKHVGACSAGALMAGLFFSGKDIEAIDFFMKKTAVNEKNVYWKNIFNDKPVFPHYEMYRELLETSLDEKAFNKLKKGPVFDILIALPPRILGSIGGVLAGFSLYSLEKAVRKPVHATWSSKAGYKPLVLRVQDMKTPGELHDAILMSSCTPPFVPIMKYNGRPVLDGGLVDNVPLLLAPEDSKNTLVLLTRYYNNVPQSERVLYAAPSSPITIDKWDYTWPEGFMEAYTLGKSDGMKIE